MDERTDGTQRKIRRTPDIHTRTHAFYSINILDSANKHNNPNILVRVAAAQGEGPPGPTLRLRGVQLYCHAKMPSQVI